MTDNIITSCVNQPKARFVFAHGAGADMNHSFMMQMTQLLLDKKIEVVRFNFPYMMKRIVDGKRRPPDRMPKLIESYLACLKSLPDDLPLFIGGKSMGGRVAATLASENAYKVSGVVCLGYPFHPPKKLDKLRLEPLQTTTAPVLIIQGQRDPMGTEEEVLSYALSDKCHIEFLPDGDHDLKPRKRSGYSHEQHLNFSAKLIEKFIDEYC